MSSLSPKFVNSLNFTSSHLSTLRKLGEYRGKQDLFNKKSKEVLEALKQHAIIESIESSNRLEQITAPAKRIKGLVAQSTAPENRSEQEIAGYRDVLSLIHKSYKDMEVSVNIIKQLHTMLYRHLSEDGGSFKLADNKIVERDVNGNIIRERFTPVSAFQTPQAMDQLCQSYNDFLNTSDIDPLVLFPLLILDFLCIHPFKDGNGRISRLLTLLVLHQYGYEVGKYISLERIFEQSKEGYYNTLRESSQNWHEGKHDPFPWMDYFWGTVIRAYKEFEEKVDSIKKNMRGRGSKTAQIKTTIRNKIGPFLISDIEKDCPHIGRDMIRNVLRQLRDEGRIKSTGIGRGAKWINVINKLPKEISDFQTERIQKILSDAPPMPLMKGPKLVLHIIPVEFFHKHQALAVQKISHSDRGFGFQPICILFEPASGGWNTKFNFDGFVNYDASEKGRYLSYTQVFQNAVIEAADTYTIAADLKKDGKILTPQNYEGSIIQALSLYTESLSNQNIYGACFVFLSLLKVRGYTIYNELVSSQDKNISIDRDNLFLPEIYIEDLSKFSPPDIMKPAFDRVWNAGGYIGSRNYNQNGKWNPVHL